MAVNKEIFDIVLNAKDQYSKELDHMDKRFKLSSKTLAIGAGAIGAAAVAAGASIYKLTRETANAGDMFQKMSLRTGFSVESLSELAHAAELSGTSINEMESGFKKLSKNMADARDGAVVQKREFERLGITLTDNNGELRDAEDVFDDVVKSLSEMKNETQQTASAMTIFGRSGATMLPLIKSGTDGINAMRQSAKDLGITFTTEGANAAATMNDNLLELERNITGLKQAIGNALIPAVNRMFAAFRGKTDVEKFSEELTDLESRIPGLEQRIVSLDKSWFATKWEKERARKDLEAVNLRIEYLKELQEAWGKKSGMGGGMAGGGGVTDTGISPIKPDEKDDIDKEQEEFLRKQVELAQMGSDSIVAQKYTEIERIMAAIEQGNTDYITQLAEEQQLRQESINLEIAEEERLAEETRRINQQRVADDRAAAEEEVRIREAAEKAKYSAVKSTVSNIGSALDSLGQISDNKNRTIFEASKIARVTEGVLNTYSAIQTAFGGSGIPYPYNLIAAAAAGVAGAANVAKIASTKFGDTTVSPSSSGAASPIPGVTDITLPTTTLTNKPAQNITINVTNPLGDENWDDIAENLIVPALERAGDRNVQVIL